ncbi:N-acetyl-D-Glu racemase DgcA [Motiliproteus sp. MSK22-1]|uniref:N-acetyl-D-Glu racemase DgcA n=1 Tax=Motiliproteus sp. MSK22-1 TaxID=1897630 RepID=UPI000977E613|nr:N-acetyl-D-Glu racemase DgcA [Motiliproteus sp. MSK22-1]OMH25546.1 dipeptide epimerase [Motiliproteus sp. MSK22-1]
MSRKISISSAAWPIRGAFTISRGSRTEAIVLNVRIEENGIHAQGECVPYLRYGETVDSVTEQIQSIQSALESGMNRTELQTAMAPGAARNAVDAALWDLEAKKSGKRAWELAGVTMSPATTVYTISLDTPEAMESNTREHSDKPILKLKLGGKGDLERVAAVRRGSPDARIVVDANEAWSKDIYQTLIPVLVKLGVEMIEQPFPADNDEILTELERPIAICADESCHDRNSLAKLVGKYDMINIKLDKTGGLTEALAMKKEAEDLGFDIMAGCMLGSSLAMAPAMVVAQGCKVVDLDAPLLLARDCEPGLVFKGVEIAAPQKELWG